MFGHILEFFQNDIDWTYGILHQLHCSRTCDHGTGSWHSVFVLVLVKTLTSNNFLESLSIVIRGGELNLRTE